MYIPSPVADTTLALSVQCPILFQYSQFSHGDYLGSPSPRGWNLLSIPSLSAGFSTEHPILWLRLAQYSQLSHWDWFGIPNFLSRIMTVLPNPSQGFIQYSQFSD